MAAVCLRLTRTSCDAMAVVCLHLIQTSCDAMMPAYHHPSCPLPADSHQTSQNLSNSSAGCDALDQVDFARSVDLHFLLLLKSSKKNTFGDVPFPRRFCARKQIHHGGEKKQMLPHHY
eukprot:6769265-Ditylum_brightwellii.AAC.1